MVTPGLRPPKSSLPSTTDRTGRRSRNHPQAPKRRPAGRDTSPTGRPFTEVYTGLALMIDSGPAAFSATDSTENPVSVSSSRKWLSVRSRPPEFTSMFMSV